MFHAHLILTVKEQQQQTYNRLKKRIKRIHHKKKSSTHKGREQGRGKEQGKYKQPEKQ